MSTLTNRLSEALDDKGISKSELARRVGISRQVLNGYFSERSRPSKEVIADLANVLGVNPAWLDEYDVPKYVSNGERKHELTLEEALASVMSYDGKPMTDNDKEIIEGIIKGYMENKKE